MAFNDIVDTQPHVVKLLENSIKRDRLSHAYLFEGEPGTKKFETALYFAQMLLCKEDENVPCLTCHNCVRIAHYTHPNVYVVTPEKNTIRKQAITDLQREFSKTSVEPGPKIFIIKQIELINASAANSLLKFLEEPHPNTHGILTTNNINKLLPTIISRSQVVKFSPTNNQIVEKYLSETHASLPAKIVSHLTNSKTEATNIIEADYFLDLVSYVKELYRLILTKEQPPLIYFKESCSIVIQDTKISALFLSIMSLFQRDLVHYKTNNIDTLIFKEELNTIKQLANQKTKEKLIEELEHMMRFKSRLYNYINQRLAYDNLLLSLERR
ncbi:MAG: hypothetical protein K9L74_02115 [Candidatus Izimaplasma sp.]|nr:hypothetical protein [Candidatus Izimaplasma bacterium]